MSKRHEIDAEDLTGEWEVYIATSSGVNCPAKRLVGVIVTDEHGPHVRFETRVGTEPAAYTGFSLADAVKAYNEAP